MTALRVVHDLVSEHGDQRYEAKHTGNAHTTSIDVHDCSLELFILEKAAFDAQVALRHLPT